MTTTAAASTDTATTVWPGIAPRLLKITPGPEDVTAYRSAGGYRPLPAPAEFLTSVEHSGLLGRGGAAFPLAVKLATVREAALAGTQTVVVANGEEGEPASIKDRWLLRHRPHLVLDGLRLAAHTVGATRVYVYVSDPAAAHGVEVALGEADALDQLTIQIFTVEPGYVAGEETAALRAINGGPAKPSDKPPRPYQHGVAGLPTVVSNVETLANLPYIHAHGASEFRALGTAGSPGSFLATISGAGRAPVLYELPYGVQFGELLELHRVAADQVRGALMGGYFAGLLNRDVLGATLDHESLRGMGSGLGCGAIAILTEDCPVAVAASVLAYFDRENAGQCGSCFNGTAAMAAVATALRDGTATSEDVARLRRWSVGLRGRGACGTLDGAANVAASLLAQFPDVVQHHLDNEPTVQRTPRVGARPYAIEELTA